LIINFVLFVSFVVNLLFGWASVALRSAAHGH
jgi:hypothetical protein